MTRHPRPPKSRQTSTAQAAEVTGSPIPSTLKPTLQLIGIGASAGGLEALEIFLKHVPPGSEWTIVVVQHLDPTHKGMLPEILQRSSAAPVLEIVDGLQLERDRVYIIPPGRDLSIRSETLHLHDPAAPRGLRLPIDSFFRSLAEERGPDSIGVLLSGMGSDGTLGGRAIKERGGTLFVQDPLTAKFAGMPTSAVKAGLADIIAPVEELPRRIFAFLSHHRELEPAPEPHAIEPAEPTDASEQPTETEPERPLSPLTASERAAIGHTVAEIRLHTGHDFSNYKLNTLHRRIVRRTRLHQLSSMEDYAHSLQGNAQEANLMCKELLIGVTRFFRDPGVWELMKAEILPAIISARLALPTASRPTSSFNPSVLRAWVPACSTGEEAYSLAIAFKEVLEELRPQQSLSLQIFATDLDKDAIDRARTGHFLPNIVADVSEGRLRRFFTEDDHGFVVGREIRDMIVFAPHNLIADPPFTKLDLLTCRNLLIYLDTELQLKLLRLFHYSLRAGGFLVLGSTETLGAASGLFSPLAGKQRAFRRLNLPPSIDGLRFKQAGDHLPTSTRVGSTKAATEGLPSSTGPSLQILADQLLLQRYSPAAVLVTESADIVYVNGKTGKYLEPAAGKANLNLFAMARAGLNDVLLKGFRDALRRRESVHLRSIPVGSNGGTVVVDVEIHPLLDPEPLGGLVLVVFLDSAVSGAEKLAPTQELLGVGDSQFAALRLELQQSQSAFQFLHQEMLNSEQELQSRNEELQSTNEELNTSQEEIQSMNEELQTVNSELQANVDELTRASNDMKNLLDSTDIATLFLDDKLNVRRFTAATTRIIKLIATDVGRPITDLVTDLDYPALAGDVQEVLRKLLFVEKQVSTQHGLWFTVRIMPYRTHDNRIDGVVITFADITVAKNLELELRRLQATISSNG